MSLLAITKTIKDVTAKVTDEEFRKAVHQHYLTMGLSSIDHKWTKPEFEQCKDVLFPPNLAMKTVYELLEQSAFNLKQNDYLNQALSVLSSANLSALKNRVEVEGAEVFLEVLAYFLVLEALTKACLEDYLVFDALYCSFKNNRKANKSFKLLPPFHKLKLASIEIPVKKYLNNFKTGHVDPGSSRWGVAINIWEAVLADRLSGMKDNALAGKVLAQHKCGEKVWNKVTGAGPSGWSEDKKKVTRNYPNGAKWADLYQTWNMAFCTRFGDFPFVLPKLIIPSVSGYQEHPEEYIFRRCIALYIYLNFASFVLVNKKTNESPTLNWHDQELQKIWNQCNESAANDYLASLNHLYEAAT